MDWPAKATFVTPEEKELVTARLQADSDAVADESVSWKNVLSAMSDYKVWLYGACFHTLSLPLYTLSMFLVHSSPDHFLKRQKLTTSPAINHQRPRLQRRRSPTPNNPTIRSGNHPNRSLRRRLGTLLPPRPLYPLFHLDRHHRLHHPAKQHLANRQTGHLLPRSLLRRSRNLPLRSPSPLLASGER